MRKIFLSLFTIAALGTLVVGVSRAFLSDTEKSQGNTFIAGAIDLKIDNTCHYNGKTCTKVNDVYLWEGTDEPCFCSWEPADLKGKAIFDFQDVKPGDKGEDTISLHVDTNPAWICAEISDIVKKENNCTEPEAKVDTSCEETAPETGELWDNLSFSAWRDNGAGTNSCNNIKDSDEDYLFEDQKVTAVKWPVADSTNNGTPVNDTCLGISWQVPSELGNIIQTDSVSGTITFNAYQARNNQSFFCYNPQITINKSIVNDNGGTAQASDFSLSVGGKPFVNGVFQELPPGTYAVAETGPSGYTPVFEGDCDTQGNLTVVPNKTYTCTVTNNDIAPQLTIIKHLVKDNGGTAVAGNWTMDVTATNPSNNHFAGQESPGVTITLNPDSYGVSESGGISGYSQSLSADCSGTISLGQSKTCTITNDDISATLKIEKTVVNDNGGTKVTNDFGLKIDGNPVQNNVAVNVNPGNHTASEVGLSGYTASSWAGDCAADGTVTLSLGENKTCTISNDDIQPKLTVTKIVTNNSGGNKTVANFPLFVSATPVTSGQQYGFNAGNYIVSETQQSGYAATIGGNCASNGAITLNPGDVKACTITNDDIQATLKIVKTVVNDNGGGKAANDFGLKIDATSVSNNTPLNVNPGSHTASESTSLLDSYGYTASAWAGDCASNGTVTVNLGENKSCTITNDDIPRQFTNGGFDNGNLTGWTIVGPASVANSYIADLNNGSYQGPTYNPRNGSWLGVLTAGLGQDVYTTANQQVFLTSGKCISGYAAFDAIDYLPYNDDAAATVTVKGGSASTRWSSNIQAVGSYGETPWTYWNYCPGSSGIYTVELKVRNTVDNAVNSIAIFDYIRVY